MDKILIAVSTYNQLDYTQYCINSLKKIDEVKSGKADIIVIDDVSTDKTVDWLKANDIEVIEKKVGKGLTDTWNVAYKYFKEHKEYKYLIELSDDTIVPNFAFTELYNVAEKWPFSVVCPMSHVFGAGHNAGVQGLEKIFQGVDPLFASNPNNVQAVQNNILAIKDKAKTHNSLYQLDPVRIKMFNGFCFLMSRKVIEYEREDGLLFDPTKTLYKGEDEFNWSKLIPNDDFAAVVQTSFVFHFKGVSTIGFGMDDNDPESFAKKREEIESE